MVKRLIRWVLPAFAALIALPAAASGGHGHRSDPFVRREGAELVLEREPFRFAGTNNYYLMYRSPLMVDSVLEAAKSAGFDVIRTWGSAVIGKPDFSDALSSDSQPIYFQFWDTPNGAPGFNDGADGLQKLDYVVAKAAELGLRLVFPLTNNWREFGGMDQMVRWRENQLPPGTRTFYHSDFYTDPVIRQWYKDWIFHLLNRVNTITGIAYKDDPTIMLWELGNEPRCVSNGVYPRAADCSTDTLTAWADEMSRYIKGVDGNHLVSVGDEGFFCVPGATHWTDGCGEGVDSVRLTKLRHIDVMSFHAYPDSWGTDAAWTTEWIRRHLVAARRVGKPAMLGEFGWQDETTRNVVFKQWTDAVLRYGGAGALYWILSAYQDNGSLYPDYDGYTVYCPSAVCTTLANFGLLIAAGVKPRQLGPVADDDAATTESAVPVVYTPAANDIAYGARNTVLFQTIDLDPATVGRQASISVAAGSFVLQTDGSVLYTPATDFYGNAEISYTIEDRRGRLSDPATLSAVVKPRPGAPIQLFSFESGTEGWAPASWEPTNTVVSHSSTWSSSGGSSLYVDSITGGWVGVELATPLDLSNGYSAISIDRRVDDAVAGGTSHNMVIQLGSAYAWCEGVWAWVPNTGSSFQTLSFDLLALSDSCRATLADIRTIRVYANGDGWIDNVRAH